MVSDAEFGRLFEKHQKDAYKFALSLCKNPTDAEDFTQEAFIHALEHKESYDPSKPFVPWLFTIIRHKFVDRLRKEAGSPFKSTVHLNGDGDEEPLDVIDENQLSPDEIAGNKELMERVSRLTGSQKVVMNHYCEGRTLREIADLMGLSFQRVHQILLKAAEKIRR